MAKDDLPHGLMVLIKSATRAMVLAAAAPGSTGPERVSDLTGHSRGAISRWQGDAYKDLPPLDVVFQIESITGAPVFARALAALTGHRLVPLGEGDEQGSMVSDLIGVTQSSARVSSELGAALGDDDVTPNEAKIVMKAIAEHEAALESLKRKLAGVKAKGGNP